MMDDDDVILSILVITFFMGLMMYFLTPGTPVMVSGEVMDKMYQPASRTSGTAIGGKGQFLFLSGSSPEKWTVVLKGDDIQSYDVAPSVYYTVQVGEVVTLDCGTKFSRACQAVSDVGEG